MSTSSNFHQNFLSRQNRTRSRLALHQEKPRLSVYRSLRHIFAQIIDDRTGKTLVSASDLSLKVDGKKTETASQVGVKIAELAKAQKITAVRFDRGGYKYHGRIAALAEAARQNGLTF